MQRELERLQVFRERKLTTNKSFIIFVPIMLDTQFVGLFFFS